MLCTGQEGFTLRGCVCDSSGGFVIPYVEISIDSTRFRTTGNAQGMFFLILPAKKEYTVRITATGYDTKQCRLTAGSIDTIVIRMVATTIELDEVTVTSTRFATSTKETPELTRIITTSEIRKSGSTEIASAISSTMAGADFYNEGSGMTFTMQGMDSKYTLFLIDGERIAGENHDNTDYYRLGISHIEKIEIVKGASSALYGSNAMGGVVNLITKRPVKPVEVNLHGKYSKFREMESGADIGFCRKNVSSYSSILRKSTGGYDLTHETPDLYTMEPYTLYNLFQKFIFNPVKGLEFIVKGSYYSRERFDVSQVPVHPLYKGYSGSFTGNYSVSDNFSFSASYHADRYENFSVLELLEGQRRNIYYDLQHTGRISGKYSRAFGGLVKNQNLIAGTEMFHERMFSLRIEDSSCIMNNFNLFFLGETKFGKHWRIAYGGRYDEYPLAGRALTPKINMMYSTGDLNIRASYGHGFRFPGIKERFYDFDLGFIRVKGNNALRPEHSKYGSLSAEYNHKKIRSCVNAHVNRLNDMIHDVLVINTTNEFTYVNICKVLTFGLDARQQYFAGKNWWFDIGYNYIRAFDIEKKEELGGVNKHSATAGIEYKWIRRNYKASVSFGGKLYSRKKFENYDSQNYVFFNDYYPPYSLWRASFTQELHRNGVILTLGVSNIFDYRNHTDLINIDPGRRFFVLLEISIDTLSNYFKSKNK